MLPTLSEAQEIITSGVKTLGTEKRTSLDSIKHVLAEKVYADISSPPFDKSAMDGYACKIKDIDKKLELIEEIPAGKLPQNKIKTGQCAKIMTGAVIPEGADTVFMKEDAEVLGEKYIKCTNPNSKRNICYKGEDVKVGDKLFNKGELIRSHHMPTLALAGYHQVKVYKMPKVGVITTGSEIVEPHNIPQNSQIRNTNAYQILALLYELGISGDYVGIAKDKEIDIRLKIETSLNKNTITLVTGGVSVGDYDLVPDIVEKLGLEIKLRGSAIQPGKPMVYATNGKQYFFGLSGNPVSSFLQFQFYVRGLILALQSAKYELPSLVLKFSQNFTRKRGDRLMFKPGLYIDDNVVPVDFHGSAHISAMAKANCIIEIPQNVTTIKQGQPVKIYLL